MDGVVVRARGLSKRYTIGRRRHDWDRACARELFVAPAKRELPTPTPGYPTE